MFDPISVDSTLYFLSWLPCLIRNWLLLSVSYQSIIFWNFKKTYHSYHFSANNRPWVQRNSTALQVVYIFATLIYYSIFDSQKFFLVKIWLYVTVGLLKPVSNLVANQTKWDYYIQAVWPWFIIDFRQCENYDSTLVVIFMPGTCCLKYETNELQ